MLFSKYKWLEKQFHEIKVIPEISKGQKKWRLISRLDNFFDLMSFTSFGGVR
jgi:hypothetical protein